MLSNMTDWQLVFGDSLRNAVMEINLRAIERNTVKAYNEAIHRLHGIDYLLLCMGFRGDVTIRLMNEISKLEKLQDKIKRPSFTVEQLEAIECHK